MTSTHNDLRSFRYKILGAVVLGSTISLSLIGTISAAQPPRLRLSGAHGPAGAMAIFENYDFRVGPDVSHDASSGPVYTLAGSSDASSYVSQVANLVGVNGTVEVGRPDNYFTTSDRDASGTVMYNSEGSNIGVWSYTSSAARSARWDIFTSSSNRDSAHGFLVSSDAESQVIDNFARTLYPDFSLVPGDASSVWTYHSEDASGHSTQLTSVSETLVVGGVKSDQSVSFTFAEDGSLYDASGPDLRLAGQTNYPWLSPADAVAQINSDQPDLSVCVDLCAVPYLIGGGPDVSVPVLRLPAAPRTASSTPSVVGGVNIEPGWNGMPDPPVPVTLGGADVEYHLAHLSNHTAVLVPIYIYTGQVGGEHGWNGSWRAIAVDPAYVDVGASGGVRNY